MPWKKPPEKPFIEMERLLKGYDLTPPKLASVLGVSVPTAREKLNNPHKLTLKDLRRIHRFHHIPIQEIRDAIRG